MKSPLKGALGDSPRHHRAPTAQQDQRFVGAPWCLEVRAGVWANGPKLDHGSRLWSRPGCSANRRDLDLALAALSEDPFPDDPGRGRERPPARRRDGLLVLAEVYAAADSEETITAQAHRMVFVNGTEPAKAIAALSEGERLQVLGIPRVNLAEVAAIAADHVDDPVQVKLPYEMIVVAVLPPEEVSGAPEK
jgi:hypothetical protein